MIKLLWVGDSVVNTGFARVTDTICTELGKTGKYDITVLGINYRGDPHDKPYKVYPTWQTDMLGLTRIAPLVDYIKPDIIVLFSDIWVVTSLWLPRIPDTYKGKLVTYFPIDAGPYDEKSWIENLAQFNKVATYTEFGKQVLRDAGFEGTVYTLPHGVDTEKFYPIDRDAARKALSGIEEDDFVVLNANRNTPRKRIDLTIKGFAEFSKMVDGKKPKLYLHMGIKDAGVDILRLADRYLSKGQLLITSTKISAASGVDDRILNYIYNATDIGLNTAGAEGWGLVSWEHSACKKPQIVPGYSAPVELYKGKGILLKPAGFDVYPEVYTEGAYYNINDIAGALYAYYSNQKLREKHANAMYDFIMQPEFTWANIAQRWDKEVLDG